mgnify:CR=1 FL=1
MEGSREEVMRFMLQVIAEFQILDERTQASVLGAGVLLTTDTIDADTRERLREYDSDMHCAAELYTESGAHVSRHSTSVARVNDGSAGGSARSHNDD